MLPFITADSVAVCYSYISLPLSFLCCRSSLLIQCVFPCCFYVAVHHCWFSGCVLFLHQFTLVVPMLPFITADSVAVCHSYISLPLLFLCCRSSLLIQCVLCNASSRTMSVSLCLCCQSIVLFLTLRGFHQYDVTFANTWLILILCDNARAQNVIAVSLMIPC